MLDARDFRPGSNRGLSLALASLVFGAFACGGGGSSSLDARLDVGTAKASGGTGGASSVVSGSGGSGGVRGSGGTVGSGGSKADAAAGGSGGGLGTGGSRDAGKSDTADAASTLVCGGKSLSRQTTCTVPTACGGNVSGTWSLSGGCLADDVESSLKALLTVQTMFTGKIYGVTGTVTATVEGTVTFQDGTMSRKGSICTIANISLTTSGLNCMNVMTSAYKSNQLVQELTCDAAESPCRCKATGTKSLDLTAPYEIRDGHTLVVNPGAGETASDFCAQNGTLQYSESFQQLDAGTAPSAVWQLKSLPTDAGADADNRDAGRGREVAPGREVGAGRDLPADEGTGIDTGIPLDGGLPIDGPSTDGGAAADAPLPA